MPIPIILGVGAAVAGLAGIGAGIKGGIDAKEASDTMSAARRRNDKNLERFNSASERANESMNSLGKLEMDVAADFSRFTDAFEKIKNKPEFSELKLSADIPQFNFDEIHTVSVGAGAFLGAAAGGATGAVLGTAAASGVTAAVMALGTASTGTAIASLSGAAATNAALAAIGGGAIAAGGGGVALGTTLLGAATLGAGLLVGGAIFAFTGSKIKDKADEAYSAMLANEKEIEKCLSYLDNVYRIAGRLHLAVKSVYDVYSVKVAALTELVNQESDWNEYSKREKLLVENNILIVSVLHKMINTPLLKVVEMDSEGNPTATDVDVETVDSVIESSSKALSERGIIEDKNVSG